MHARNIMRSEEGQSVFEILIAMAIATIIVGSSVTAIMISQRSSSATVSSGKAYAIADETLGNVRSFAESNWADMYTQNKGEAYQYYLNVVSSTATSSTLGIASGTATTTFTSSSAEENIDYSSWFTIESVTRNPLTNEINTGGSLDPTTLKITVHVSWTTGGSQEITLVGYISKIRSLFITFDDWSGASGVVGPVTQPTKDYYSINNATIDSNGEITY
ncbi:MAG: hypothetical protein NUV96_02125 [Candidatus Colwellbacteria bacterium]|nr:hypothetical protein [Candidatus Colwellbacteria bacterium]